MYNTRITLLFVILLAGIIISQAGLTAEKAVNVSSVSTHSSNLHEKPEFNLDILTHLIHDYVNGARERNGLPLLDYDPVLAELARLHSRNMAEFQYFDHVDTAGLNPTDRAKIYGYTTLKQQNKKVTDGINENIIRIPLYKWVVVADGMTYHWRTEEEIAQTVLRGWLDSPGHRKNLLNPGAGREGIGVVITDDFRVYVTQDLW